MPTKTIVTLGVYNDEGNKWVKHNGIYLLVVV
jgi:hypothetical protein